MNDENDYRLIPNLQDVVPRSCRDGVSSFGHTETTDSILVTSQHSYNIHLYSSQYILWHFMKKCINPNMCVNKNVFTYCVSNWVSIGSHTQPDYYWPNEIIPLN